MRRADDILNSIAARKSSGVPFALATVVRTVAATAAKAGGQGRDSARWHHFGRLGRWWLCPRGRPAGGTRRPSSARLRLKAGALDRDH